MLEIVSSKGPLDLAAGTRIEFEEHFGISDYERASDLKSWRFKLPKTLANWQSLEFKMIPDAYTKEQFVTVSIYLFGTLWKKGPLYFLDEDPAHWDVSFTGELGILLSLIENKKLTDFSLPTMTIVDMYSHALDTINDPQGDHAHVFAPVDLPSLGGDVWWPAQINSVVVDSDGDLDQFPVFWTHFEADEYDANRVAIPSTSIGYLSGEWVKFEGKFYKANQNVNSGSGNSPGGNPSAWDLQNIGNIKRYNPLVPMVFVKDLLDHICGELGISIGGQIFEDEEISRLVLFNTLALNPLINDEPGEVLANTTIDYRNHVPDITLRSFLVELAMLFNQQINYSDKQGLIVFKARTTKISSYAQDGLQWKVTQIQSLFKEERRFGLTMTVNSQDMAYADENWTGNFQNYVPNTKHQQINLGIGTLPMRYGFTEVDLNHTAYPGDDDNDWFPGEMWRPVSSLSLNDKVPLQLLFYRGKSLYQNGPPAWSNVPEIPQLASDLSYVPQSGPLDQYTLLITGVNGLYEVWWKKWLYALSLARVLRVRALMDADTFASLSLDNRQKITEFVCLAEKMKLKIGAMDDTAKVELQMVKL